MSLTVHCTLHSLSKIIWQLTISKSVKQLLHLCTACTVWSDPIIRTVSVCSGKFTTRMVTNEKQKNCELSSNQVSSKPIKVGLIIGH